MQYDYHYDRQGSIFGQLIGILYISLSHYTLLSISVMRYIFLSNEASAAQLMQGWPADSLYRDLSLYSILGKLAIK